MSGAQTNTRAAATPQTSGPITGSYAASDCRFLLTPLDSRPTGTPLCERIGPEPIPSARYLRLFKALTARHRQRLATEILALTHHALATRPTPLTIVSLARAGTPIGALLQRAALAAGASDPAHYSISIIREHGIDRAALRYILRTAARPAAGVLFVDGWTARGGITRALKAAVADWNRTEPETLSDELYVLSDIGRTADLAATGDDYAIPCGLLNATVTGLVSPSVPTVGDDPHTFHGCLVYEQLRRHDLTAWFLDTVSAAFETATPGLPPALPVTPPAASTRKRVAGWIDYWMERYRITEPKFIRPGICEATRVMLPRTPARLLLRDPAHPDVEHLAWLAEQKAIPVELEPAMPFQATALVRIGSQDT